MVFKSILDKIRSVYKTTQTKFDPAFEARFQIELAKAEYLRITLLIWLVLCGFIGGMINFFAVHEKNIFDLLYETMGFLMVMVGSILTYELICRHYVLKCIKRKTPLSKTFIWINLFVEISFPTMIILLFVIRVTNMVIFFSPFILLYFLFIVLATLHLNFWMSAITGALAAVEYYLGSIFIIRMVPVDSDISILASSTTLILARVLLIFLTGVASGFVAIEIKRRVINTYRAINDRDRIRQIFGQQVSHEIVDQIISQGKNIDTKRLKVCVMFLDIRDFTPFASVRSPEEVLDYQNKLFAKMIEIVNRHHGIINQFMGDGFMAMFGAPLSGGNDCYNAVTAAIGILESTELDSKEGVIPHTRLGIGIHYGEAVTGNIGTELRKQYSIVGNVVIQASRIEQLNKEFKSQLLISRDVFQQVDHVPGESLGHVTLKGESLPLEIIRLR